jgi:HAE1 family hydrophobic/amphiphilic exporter-1
MSAFFIRRPIVAIVISVLIVLLGISSLAGLSFEQYPFLAPPIIRIQTLYPGCPHCAGGGEVRVAPRGSVRPS